MAARSTCPDGPLTGGIEFTFPATTEIPSGGYLVVAEDPATILSEFGVNALGPYAGGLSGDGEEIELRDAGGVRADRVDYGVDFPCRPRLTVAGVRWS